MPYAARGWPQARRLMQDAGFGPFNKLTLSYATPGNPDSKRLAAVFQAMARQIYVDVRITIADYALVLRDHAPAASISWAIPTGWRISTTPRNFLDLLRSGSPAIMPAIRNAEIRCGDGGGRDASPMRRKRARAAAGGRAHRAGRHALAADPLSVADRGGGRRGSAAMSPMPRLQSQPLALDNLPAIGSRRQSHGATMPKARYPAALAFGALALGAIAIGALAIGALAIGRLAVERRRIGRLEVDELVIRRLQRPLQ